MRFGMILGIGSFSYAFGLGVGYSTGFFGAGWEALTYTLVGFLVGSIIGIILVNKLLHYPGSLLLGILGCILGVVMAFALQPHFTALRTGSVYVTFAFYPLASALLGTLEFHLVGTKGFRLFNPITK